MEINIRNRTDLKSYFVKNSIPTESNFAELIDGMLNQKDDGLVKLPGNPLSIEAAGDNASEKKALNIYQAFGDPNPTWSLSLNPRTNPNDPSTAKLGFSIGDGEGNSRLFIDRNTGNIGLGTTSPAAKLDVVGGVQISDGSGYAAKNNYMASGSLTVGSINSNYGGGQNWNANTAGLLLEAKASTEIAVHDAGTRVASLMYYEGDNTNRITIGRNMGWGAISSIVLNGNVSVSAALTPSAGNTTSTGIMFPPDAFGGSGDAAWIRYHNARGGEKGTLEIGIANDGDDHIVLMPSGNVGIGITAPTQRLHVADGNAIINNVFLGNVGHGADYAGFSHSNSSTTTGYGFLQHTSGQYTLINKKSGGGYIALRIDNANKLIVNDAGNIGIGTDGPVAKLDVQQANRSGTHPTAVKGLYVTGDFGADSDGIEFRHSNASQGIGFGLNTIYATGSNTDQDLGLKARGTGKVKVTGALQISGALTPSAGNTTSTGIMFPPDAFGGSGDAAWIRYHNARGGEKGTLEIGIANDGDDHIVLMPSGNVGIGTDSPGAKLDVRGHIYAGESDIYFTNTNHDHSAIGNTVGYAAIENAKNFDALMILGRAGTDVGRKVRLWDYLEIVGTFVNHSDQRAKQDIEDLKYGLEDIKNLRPVSFNWKSIPNQHRSLGLIAQEVKPVINEVVYSDEHDPVNSGLSIAYTGLIPILINAIKELDAKLERVMSEDKIR